MPLIPAKKLIPIGKTPIIHSKHLYGDEISVSYGDDVTK